MRAVSRATLAPYLGPAAVLYLIAAAASLPGAFDLATWLTGVLAVLLSTTPLALRRHQDVVGAERVAWLGLAAAVALSTTVAPAVGMLWALEAARVVAFPALGYLLVDLALHVPESTRSTQTLRAHRAAIAFAIVGAAVAVVESIPIQAFGFSLLLPVSFSRAPEFVAMLGVVLALAIRTVRARSGGRPEAHAENAWAQLGLVPAAVLSVGCWWALRRGGLDPTQAWFRGALGLSALLLVRAHVLLIDARYRLSVGTTARRSVAITLAVAFVCSVAIALRHVLPTAPVDLALWVAAALLLAVGLHGVLSRLLRAWLAPAGGALLDALERATLRLSDVSTLSDLGAAVLPPLRDASFASDAMPLLYAFDPITEVGIDAAGQPRLSRMLPPQALTEQVALGPHETLVRRPLEDALVRRAEVRPLVEALQRLDALCVVPLRNQGELEGLLVLPRGLRHASLTLEELAALDRFAALLSAFVAVISREARAAQRVNSVTVERDAADRRGEDLVHEVARLQRHERALATVSSQGQDVASTARPIAYSPKMRVLCDRLSQLAMADVPVLLRTPPGVEIASLVALFHQATGRGDQALVLGDCAALSPSDQRVALFGSDAPNNLRPGLLRLAQGGTLLLRDIPALSLEVQGELRQAIVSKWMRPEGGEVALPLNVKILATSRVAPEELLSADRFDAELCARLSPVMLSVPTLRERAEDMPSLVLLALDRAARVLGREAIGIEPDAMNVLAQQRFVGNEIELQSVIEQAVARCDGERVAVAQLKLARVAGTSSTGPSPLAGTFDAVEKRVLRHALAMASGNKSEAARLLGLKRTTFLDKLRKHDLDDAPSPRIQP